MAGQAVGPEAGRGGRRQPRELGEALQRVGGDRGGGGTGDQLETFDRGVRRAGGGPPAGKDLGDQRGSELAARLVGYHGEMSEQDIPIISVDATETPPTITLGKGVDPTHDRNHPGDV